jgi:hypothetical protein
MRASNYVCIIILTVLFTAFFGAVIFVMLDVGPKLDIHTPTESLRKKWGDIENILLKKDAKTICEVDKLLSELAKEENNVTALLEQKASTQMGCISIVVAILLAAFSFYIKDLPKYLPKKRNALIFPAFTTSIVFLSIIFLCSIFFSYQGFKIREDFASYNIDDLFNIMKDKDSDLVSFQVSNILENYQICAINSFVNEKKADNLTLAARFFICGIMGIFMLSLITACIINNHSVLQKEVT